jgi:hypothetical protein
MSTTTTNDDTLVGPSVSHQSVPHQVNRLIFDAGQPYEKFLSRFEAIVPRWIRGCRSTALGGTPAGRASSRRRGRMA